VTRHQFDNGLIALVRENHTSQAVVMAGYLPVGAIDEPPEMAGLSVFTAASLMRGTQTRSFGQIYEEIESVGAALSVAGGRHSTGFGGKSLAEDLPLLLNTLADVLQNPSFPPKEVERLRGELLTDLEERANSTQSMANLTFRELAYPAEHPYHCSARGYPETVSALSREGLVAFHRQGYSPAGMVITVVGGIQTDQALAQIEGALGAWEGRERERSAVPPAPKPTGLMRRQVDMPNKSQVDVVMGRPGPVRAEPDFIDAALANSILGIFGLGGRLGQNVREQQGLAYYVYSRLDGGLGPGPWRIVTGVDPSNVERAIESAQEEIRRLRDAPPEAEELTDNKTYITGSLPLRLETNEGVAARLLDIEMHDLGLDYLQRYHDMIHNVTAEDVQAAARKWLDPDNLAIGLAGPSET
jgi:zinc protease